MDILTIGNIIKKERKACGLSQKALAAASHVSRATVVNLEKGKSGDIGAVKLSIIADNVGKPMFSPNKNMDFVRMILVNINTSYKTTMTADLLEYLLQSGILPSGFEGQVMHLIDETSTALIAGTIKQLAAKKNLNAKLAWRNLAKIAAQIQSPNKFWHSVG